MLSHQVKNICLENRCLVWGVVMVKLELLMSGREVCLCFYFWPSRSVYFTYPKNKQKQLRASHFLIYCPPCPTFVSLVYGACSYVVFFNLVFLGGFELGISTKLTRGPDQLFGFVSWWECLMYRKLGYKPEGESNSDSGHYRFALCCIGLEVNYSPIWLILHLQTTFTYKLHTYTILHLNSYKLQIQLLFRLHFRCF